jgi:hypothetical protein
VAKSAWAILDNLSIWMTNVETPPQAEWDAYLQAVTPMYTDERDKHGLIRRLIFTDGGAPDVVQRDQLFNLMKGSENLSSLVNISPEMVGVSTVFSWFKIDMARFHPSQVVQALEHIRVPVSEMEKVWAVVTNLESQVEGGVMTIKLAEAPLRKKLGKA